MSALRLHFLHYPNVIAYITLVYDVTVLAIWRS